VTEVATAVRTAAVSAVLPPSFAAVQQARALVHRALDDWEVGSIGDDVALVVSELVANALVHGLKLPADGGGRVGVSSSAWPGVVEIKLVSTGSHLICTVRDPSAAPPIRRRSDESALGGRGLQLIESLSLCWGWTPAGGAKSVWAVFPLAHAHSRRAEPVVSLRAS